MIINSKNILKVKVNNNLVFFKVWHKFEHLEMYKCFQKFYERGTKMIDDKSR